MSHYPHLVQLSWHAVEKLVLDWSSNPHYWEREIDIQSELRNRLSTIFSLTGFGEVILQEQDDSPSRRNNTYRYCRVACEPSINYIYSDGKQYRAMPDVVVWDVLPNPLFEPDNWPILWACEIKYKSNCDPNWDIEKLEYLIDQQRIHYGCSLIFCVDNSIDAPLVSWEKTAHGTRLWKCIVIAPST